MAYSTWFNPICHTYFFLFHFCYMSAFVAAMIMKFLTFSYTISFFFIFSEESYSNNVFSIERFYILYWWPMGRSSLRYDVSYLFINLHIFFSYLFTFFHLFVYFFSGETFQVKNPATGAVIGSVPNMNAGDTNVAIHAAKNVIWLYIHMFSRFFFTIRWIRILRMIFNHRYKHKLVVFE